jgi:arylsulfatase A-like enzyme
MRAAMPSVLPLLLVACPQPPMPQRPDGFVDPELTTTGAGASLGLHVREARWTFGPVPSTPGLTTEGLALRFQESGRRNGPRVWKAPLPLDLGSDGRRAAPTGMVLRVGGAEARYQPTGDLAERAWRVKDRQVVLQWSDDVVDAVLEWPALGASLMRHDRAAVTGTDQEFATGAMTVEGLTRNGLILPAPASGSWDVHMPDGTVTFEGWVAIEPAPFTAPVSDGARLTLRVATPSGAEIASQQRVTGHEFVRWRADLTRWAGKDVTLTLEAESTGTPDLDWVFVGSPTVWGSPTGPVRQVVVIGLDTTRPDRLDAWGGPPDIAPEFNAIAATSVVFDHAWTPAPRTRPSFRAATTGRDPLEAVGAENVGAAFQRNGFVTGAIVANIHLQPRFDFDDGFDTWFFDGKAKADEQVDRALAWMDEHADRDSYLFLHFMDPHLLYNAPGAFRSRFVPDPDPELPQTVSRSSVLARLKKGTLTDRQKDQLRASYDAEMAFLSSELGRLFDRMDRSPGKRLTVIHSDHGEELFEHGGFEHNHALWPELTHAVMMVRAGPGNASPRRVSAPVTLVDIAPTLYELTGIADPPPSDGVSLVPYLTEARADDPDRVIGTAHLRYGHDRWGVVAQRHLYVLHTGSGQQELYDLRADPGAQRDLSAQAPLEPFHAALAQAHRMDVGPGWRVFVTLHPAHRAASMSVRLPAQARAAGVIDPELTVENPRNQEWGEAPRRVPGEIGSAALSADGLTLTWTPGTNPIDGVLWVRFDAPVPVDGVEVQLGDKPIALAREGAAALARGPMGTLRIEPGVVNVPPPSEASRIASMRAAAGEDALRMLEELGYLDDDEAHGPP